LGARVKIRLKEADGLTGASVFELVGKDSADIEGVTFKKVKSYSGKSKKDRKGKKGGKKRYGKKPPKVPKRKKTKRK
jgi:hypothetical protein